MKTSSRSRPGAALTLVAACCLVFSGCEAGSSVAPFSGVVSYQGAPLQFGSVTMQPVSGGPVARGDIQPDGSFELQTDGRPGATIGQNRVRVICYSSQSPEATAASAGDEASVGKSLIPERYSRFSSSGLVLDVKLGQQEPVKIELSP